MTRSKLSDSEKQEMVNLYRQPGETTSSLAQRYGVSSTTIRRMIKASLAEEEYEALTSLKQSGRSLPMDVADLEPIPPVDDSSKNQRSLPVSNQNSMLDAQAVSSPLPAPVQEEEPAAEASTAFPKRRSRKRSSAAISAAIVNQIEPPENGGIPAEEVLATSEIAPELVSAPDFDNNKQVEDLEELLGEEIEDSLDSDLDTLEEDLEEEDDLDENDLDIADPNDLYIKPHIQSETLVHILPLSEASIPRICYLVIDHSAELITRPLKDFGELGQIPPGEIQERTLPVFDNHRIARRFSNRAQRVVKVPDGNMLQKACPQLSAKGITRLLINGQVYSLWRFL